jgi:hypothetical protein
MTPPMLDASGRSLTAWCRPSPRPALSRAGKAGFKPAT